MEVAASSTLNLTSSMTVEAWVKTNTTTGTQTVISKYGKNDGGYRLELANGKVEWDFMAGGAIATTLTGATTVTTGVWHHLAGVWDGRQMAIYLDGVQDALKTKSITAPSSGLEPLEVGVTNVQSVLNYFNGLIDEARVSNVALYTANFSPNAHPTASSSTKGLWKFVGE